MKTLEELKNSQNNLLIMHYACTLFGTSTDKVTSISVKAYSETQIECYNIDEKRDEKQLLLEFIDFMKKHQSSIIVTWNQTTPQYGPQHLLDRCKKLGVTENLPFEIDAVVDLDGIFGKKYGLAYVSHPKLRSLAQLNGITMNDFVDGKQEPELFENKEYVKLRNSTNRKVKIITEFLECAFNNKLKVEKTDHLLKQPEPSSTKNNQIINVFGKNVNIGNDNIINSENTINSNNKITSQNSKFPKWQLIVAVIVGVFVIFGVIWGVLQTPDKSQTEIPQLTISEQTSNEKEETKRQTSYAELTYSDVWNYYNGNKPFKLSWTSCGFATITSSEGEKSWKFSMSPIMLDKSDQPATIPFSISYFFMFEGFTENNWFSLNFPSVSTQLHPLKPDDNTEINFPLNQAFKEAESKGVSKVRIIKMDSSFNAFIESENKNLLDHYVSDENNYVVTQFEFSESTKGWDKLSITDSICDNLYHP